MFINMFISEPKDCAILYAGINRTGAVANILEGEFEHVTVIRNSFRKMPLKAYEGLQRPTLKRLTI